MAREAFASGASRAWRSRVVMCAQATCLVRSVGLRTRCPSIRCMAPSMPSGTDTARAGTPGGSLPNRTHEEGGPPRRTASLLGPEGPCWWSGPGARPPTRSPQEAVTDMAAQPLPETPGVPGQRRRDNRDAQCLDPVAVEERVGVGAGGAEGELGEVHQREKEAGGPGCELEAGAGEEGDADAEEAGHEQPVGPRAGDVLEEAGERTLSTLHEALGGRAAVDPSLGRRGHVAEAEHLVEEGPEEGEAEHDAQTREELASQGRPNHLLLEGDDALGGVMRGAWRGALRMRVAG